METESQDHRSRDAKEKKFNDRRKLLGRQKKRDIRAHLVLRSSGGHGEEDGPEDLGIGAERSSRLIKKKKRKGGIESIYCEGPTSRGKNVILPL